MPTGTSTILGVFQAIFGLLAHRGTGLCILVNSKGNMEFQNRAIEFQVRRHKFVSYVRRIVRRVSTVIRYRRDAKSLYFREK